MHYKGIIVYCASVSIMCLFICEQFEILGARITSLLLSFFLSVNLLLWQEPWKKGKLVVKKPVPGFFIKKKIF